MNRYQAGIPGDVWEFVLNDIRWQVLKMDDGTFMVQGGDFMFSGCADEYVAMRAIMVRLAALQGQSIDLDC
ncbi:hypothetical protein OG410_25925 [Streptomyces sp. NBC_00659]|uniref:hypothetical protein n=1 Tax=Streptomyces sp. NBC_00659 TaxID=2903669 RepID=UPI002E345EA2|nr:hypothetical protein [Streptomyces sp. NBC_00659]